MCGGKFQLDLNFPPPLTEDLRRFFDEMSRFSQRSDSVSSSLGLCVSSLVTLKSLAAVDAVLSVCYYSSWLSWNCSTRLTVNPYN